MHNEYGTAITTQRQMATLEGCGTIEGNLNIDCQYETEDTINDVSILETIARVTGVIRIANCNSSFFTNISFPLLEAVEGSIRETSIVIENTELEGGLMTIFPNIIDVSGGVYVHGNPNLGN